MEELFKSFGERLRKERNRLDMTQVELAEKLSLTQMTISLYETSKSIPTIKFLYEVHQIGFNLSYLIFDSSEEIIERKVQHSYQKLAAVLDLLEKRLGHRIATEIKVELIDRFLN